MNHECYTLFSFHFVTFSWASNFRNLPSYFEIVFFSFFHYWIFAYFPLNFHLHFFFNFLHWKSTLYETTTTCWLKIEADPFVKSACKRRGRQRRTDRKSILRSIRVLKGKLCINTLKFLFFENFVMHVLRMKTICFHQKQKIKSWRVVFFVCVFYLCFVLWFFV
jgi:hypothetical protein